MARYSTHAINRMHTLSKRVHVEITQRNALKQASTTLPCPKAHCPSQALGFPNEKGLKRHLFQTRKSEGDRKEPSFPEKKTKIEDDVFSAVSAAIEGDSNAVLQLIGFPDSINKLAIDRHTTPLGLAINIAI